MKEVEVNGKTYKIKELKYLEAVELECLSSNLEKAKKMIKLSVGLSEEELANLSIKDGIEIQKAILEINGLNDLKDFQNPTVSKQN